MFGTSKKELEKELQKEKMINTRLIRENERLKKRIENLEKEINKFKHEENLEYLKVPGLTYRKTSSEVNWSICTISKVINGSYD